MHRAFSSGLSPIHIYQSHRAVSSPRGLLIYSRISASPTKKYVGCGGRRSGPTMTAMLDGDGIWGGRDWMTNYKTPHTHLSSYRDIGNTYNLDPQRRIRACNFTFLPTMTDVLRLLTRSATFTQKKPAPVSALPKSEKGRKQKSTRENANPTGHMAAAISVPKELDFFGLLGRPAKKRRRVSGDQSDSADDDRDTASGEEEGEDAEIEPPALPTVDEIKSTLHAHKLKYTILAPRATAPADDKNSEESKKKKKNETERSELDGPKKSKKPGLLIPPLTDFSQLRSSAHGYALSKRVYANILAQGYSAPTEVQMGAIPVLMKRDLGIEGVLASAPIDLVTCAPTGSGKTLAYVVPLIDRLMRSRKAGGTSRKGIKAVILAPTKELVGQIVNEVRKLVRGTGIRVSRFRRGHRPVSWADTLAEDGGEPCVKSDIIVSTPQLLNNAIGSAGEAAMTAIFGLVLDEADVLLDELFREQTLAVWEALRDRSAHLRTSLWSATMPSSTENLVTAALLATSSNPSPPHVVRLIVGIKDTSLPTISQALVYTASERGKLLALRQRLSSGLRAPVLIFVQSIPRAQALFNEILYDLSTPGRIAVLHSELTDAAREETMTRFRLGEVWILITTDLLSRGMDFHGIRLVINYDIPTSVASYIHRVGRTGRAGTEDGEAVTYYTKEDIVYVRGIATASAAASPSAKEGSVQKWLLDSLPKTSKRDKKKLKLHGVEVRQSKDPKHRISTKSGPQRQLRDRRKGAIEASKRRKAEAVQDDGGDGEGADSDEFTGFD